MPRCFRSSFLLLAAVLAVGAGRAQTVSPAGTPSSLGVATAHAEQFGTMPSGEADQHEVVPLTAVHQLRTVLDDGWAGMRTSRFLLGGTLASTASDRLPASARLDLRTRSNASGAPASTFALGAPYPNPFTDTATLTYTLDRPGPVRIELFDALGRQVSVIEDESRPAGEYRVRFNGSALTPGLYIVRLTAGDQVATRRLVRGT